MIIAAAAAAAAPARDILLRSFERGRLFRLEQFVVDLCEEKLVVEDAVLQAQWLLQLWILIATLFLWRRRAGKVGVRTFERAPAYYRGLRLQRRVSLFCCYLRGGCGSAVDGTVVIGGAVEGVVCGGQGCMAGVSGEVCFLRLFHGVQG